MDMKIGSKIKELRLKAGITQTELCGDVINRTILSKIENNKMMPDIKQLIHISNTLKVPVYVFFNNLDQTYEVKKELFGDFSEIEYLYKGKSYYDLIQKIDQLKINFNVSENIIFYYYEGMCYFQLNVLYDAQKVLKKFAFKYERSDEEIRKKYVLEFSIALNTLFKIMLKSKNLEKGKRYLLLAKKYIYKYNKTDSITNFIIHSNLGYVYNETKKYAETINLLETFLNNTSSIIYTNIIPDIHLSLTIAYYNLNRYEEAINHVEKSIFFYSYINNIPQMHLCYLNYINALRYSGNFDKAFEVLEKILNSISNDINLKNRFLIQKVILLINIKKYDEAYEILKEVKISKLKKQSKMNYLFVKGHLEMIEGNENSSFNHLSSCINYFSDKSYNKDLSILYKDLYLITRDEKYLLLHENYKLLKTRKNIFI